MKSLTDTSIKTTNPIFYSQAVKSVDEVAHFNCTYCVPSLLRTLEMCAVNDGL